MSFRQLGMIPGLRSPSDGAGLVPSCYRRLSGLWWYPHNLHLLLRWSPSTHHGAADPMGWDAWCFRAVLSTCAVQTVGDAEYSKRM